AWWRAANHAVCRVAYPSVPGKYLIWLKLTSPLRLARPLQQMLYGCALHRLRPVALGGKDMNKPWQSSLLGSGLFVLAALLVSPVNSPSFVERPQSAVKTEPTQPRLQTLVKTDMPVITPQRVEPLLDDQQPGEQPWHNLPRRASWVF